MAIKSKRTQSGRGGHPSVPIKHSKPDNGFEFTPIVEEDEYNDDDDLYSDLPVPTDDEMIAMGDISERLTMGIMKALVYNLDNLPKWLAKVGTKREGQALAIFKDFAEYLIPRLQRRDSKQSGGSPVQVVFEGIDQYKDREALEAKKKLQEKETEQQQAPKKAFTPVDNGKFF